MTKAQKSRFRKLYVTIREISEVDPCRVEWVAFLRDIKSNGVPRWDGDRAYREAYTRTSVYSPDAPILLSTIYNLCSSGYKGGEARVSWLLRYLPRLGPFCQEIYTYLARTRCPWWKFIQDVYSDEK